MDGGNKEKKMKPTSWRSLAGWHLSINNPTHPGYNNYHVAIAMHEIFLQYDYRKKILATLEKGLLPNNEVKKLTEKLKQNANRIDYLYTSNGLIIDDYLRVYGRIEVHLRAGCKAHDKYPYYG